MIGINNPEYIKTPTTQQEIKANNPFKKQAKDLNRLFF